MDDNTKKVGISNTIETIARYASRNPFINFLFDFKKQNKHVTGKQLLKDAGERWRSMSQEEKQPYIDAAKEASSKAKKKPPVKRQRKSKKNDQRRVKRNQTIAVLKRRRLLPVGFQSSVPSSSRSGTYSSRSRSTRSRSSYSGNSYTSDDNRTNTDSDVQ